MRVIAETFIVISKHFLFHENIHVQLQSEVELDSWTVDCREYPLPLRPLAARRLHPENQHAMRPVGWAR